MRRFKLLVAVLGVGVLALALAACGSSNKSKSTAATKANAGGPSITPSGDQKKGGTLQVQSSEGFEHLDSGQSYFQIDYVVDYATQRPLYSFKPDNPTQAQPDLASGPAQVSADGKTITVHIKPNVKFSPPVNRAVTSADVKYAIERGFSTAAPNGYATAYFGQIVGAPTTPGKTVPNISGIQTPDKTTIVFKLKSNFGATMVQALSLPLTMPVPADYAKKYDAHAPSTFDSDPTKQAFTGPYMISSFNSHQITLVRNPNWDASTDFRPAYADKIVWKTGGDSSVVARQTLAGGPTLMTDGPTPDIIKQAYQKQRDQIVFIPLGERYVALNTTTAPTNNINVRKAIIAVTDKVAMNLVRGGSLIGVPGTHFLPPGQPGFDEAGGDKGFGFDYMDTPSGNLQLAMSYMKKAGFPSGRYTGKSPITVIGAIEEPANKSTQVFNAGLTKLGFKVKYVPTPQATMYSKFCNVPKNEPDICSTVGWLPDFPDGYANLWVTFNGHQIPAENNSNWPQLNDPAVNAAMDKAVTTADPTQRNQAWAQVDKLITADAPAVEYQWSKDALLEGTAVHGVIAQWNADWDLAYSSVG